MASTLAAITRPVAVILPSSVTSGEHALEIGEGVASGDGPMETLLRSVSRRVKRFTPAVFKTGVGRTAHFRKGHHARAAAPGDILVTNSPDCHRTRYPSPSQERYSGLDKTVSMHARQPSPDAGPIS